MSRLFRVRLWLAKNLGMYRYEGMMAMARGYPMARVHYFPNENYPNRAYSCPMPIGNAVDYAEMFGGDVVPVEHKK